MTDVVKIAKERHARLAAEISKLDDFVHVAEALLKVGLSSSNKASDTEDNEAAESIGLETAPPLPAAPDPAVPYPAATDLAAPDPAAPDPATTDKKTAAAKREDVPASKPKSGQRARKPRTVLGEALARSAQRESQSQRTPPV